MVISEDVETVPVEKPHKRLRDLFKRKKPDQDSVAKEVLPKIEHLASHDSVGKYIYSSLCVPVGDLRAELANTPESNDIRRNELDQIITHRLELAKVRDGTDMQDKCLLSENPTDDERMAIWRISSKDPSASAAVAAREGNLSYDEMVYLRALLGIQGKYLDYKNRNKSFGLCSAFDRYKQLPVNDPKRKIGYAMSSKIKILTNYISTYNNSVNERHKDKRDKISSKIHRDFWDGVLTAKGHVIAGTSRFDDL